MALIIMLSVIAWFVCGIFGAGMMIAYWDKKFPMLAVLDHPYDVKEEYFYSLLGPLSLIENIIFLSEWVSLGKTSMAFGFGSLYG